ncbi:integral membrane protein GPR137 isoform X1 [Eleginops maclovinus]|uniref:integral membrane protein GPR137 isoform X1 n=1 Tax=Eleginops maclovinus TaxID=56733 RepID=UPI003080A2F0
MEALVTASPPPNSSIQPVPIPLSPAVAQSVQLGFTILYTSLYAGLFLVVYAQLWLLYIYRHKRWSYQSVFLFICLLWAALRTTLFSFYFSNALEANHLPVAAYWLLYCFPVCLQFFTFSLINLYFTQVLLKVRENYSSDVDRGVWLARCMYGAMSALFLSVNVVCAALRDGADAESGERTWNLVLVRVLINDSLFLLDAVLLAALLIVLARHSHSTSAYLISKGTTVCRTAALGAAVILLFASRGCYNLTVLILFQSHRVESFNFDWYNVSDQVTDSKSDAELTCAVSWATQATWPSVPSSSSGSCSPPASSSSSSECAGPLKRAIAWPSTTGSYLDRISLMTLRVAMRMHLCHGHAPPIQTQAGTDQRVLLSCSPANLETRATSTIPSTPPPRTDLQN